MFYSVCSLPCSRRHRNCATGVLLGVSLPSFLSGEERISFLSPARAAGLLFSPMRQKERSPKNTARKAAASWPFPALFGPPPRRKFGPSPTPLRLCKPPVGVPSGTDRAGDSANRDGFSQTSSSETRPGSPHGGRRYPPAAGQCRSARENWSLRQYPAGGGRETSSHRTPPLRPFSPCGSPPAERATSFAE